MSDRYKILSQVDINTITAPYDEVVIYSVPQASSTSYSITPIASGFPGSAEVSPESVSVNTQTLLTSMVFAFNGSGASISGDIKIRNGVAPSPRNYLMRNLVFYDKQNSTLDIRMPLSPGSTLYFAPTAYTSGNLYVTAFGIELETGYGPS